MSDDDIREVRQAGAGPGGKPSSESDREIAERVSKTKPYQFFEDLDQALVAAGRKAGEHFCRAVVQEAFYNLPSNNQEHLLVRKVRDHLWDRLAARKDGGGP